MALDPLADFEPHRELATIINVEQVTKHEDADNLALVQVKGWQVIIQCNEFQPGDLAIYCEIDSIIPPSLVEGLSMYDRLSNNKFIIKTIRLRGKYSQGLLLPIIVLNNTSYARDHGCTVTFTSDGITLGDMHLTIGTDVTSLLGITKHEAPILIEDEEFKNPKAEDPFPHHLMPTTSETRVQNIPHALLGWKGLSFVVTEKMDGTSITCYKKGAHFGVCTHSHEIQQGDDIYSKAVQRLGLHDKLLATGLGDIALQGELLGPRIQGNRYRLREHIIFFFNVIDLENRQHYTPKDAKALVENVLQLQWVPTLHDNFTLDHTVEQLVSLADGKSLLCPSADREGLIFRKATQVPEPYREHISFKCISNRWLLKFDTATTNSKNSPKALKGSSNAPLSK